MGHEHTRPRLLAPKPSVSDSSALKIQRKEALLRSQKARNPELAKHKRGQVKAACVACQRGKKKVIDSAYAVREETLQLYSCHQADIKGIV
jgi:hypothetical protein